MSQQKKKDRAALILHSGAYDRASYALSIAMVALAMGMEVHLLVTWGGLKRFVRDQADALGEETTREFREPLEKGLVKGSLQPFRESLQEAKKLGLKVYACVNAMAILSITRDELIEEVDQVVGLATFLELARDAALSLYI